MLLVSGLIKPQNIVGKQERKMLETSANEKFNIRIKLKGIV